MHVYYVYCALCWKEDWRHWRTVLFVYMTLPAKRRAYLYDYIQSIRNNQLDLHSLR